MSSVNSSSRSAVRSGAACVALVFSMLACAPPPDDGSPTTGTGGSPSTGKGGSPPSTGTGGTPSTGTGGTPSTGTGGTPSTGTGGAPSTGTGGTPSTGTGGSGPTDVAPTPDTGNPPNPPSGEGFNNPCTDAPAMTPPALKRGMMIGGFAGQAGQVTGVPGENTMYVVGHRNGNIYAVVDGKVAGTIIQQPVSAGAGNEQGMLSIVLHPQFKTNKLFYIFYTAPNQNFVIDEYERMTPTTAMKKQTIYNQMRTGGTPYHNGGSIYFSPKDSQPFLYLAMGNHSNRGQSANPNGVAGRILKFDLGTKMSSTVAYGLRNPYRMSIDRLTGDFWLGEVADPPGGSVLFLKSGETGKNYGYSPSAGISGGISGMQGGAAALIGGVVYRGRKIPGICGRYFYGMHAGGAIRSLIQNNGTRVGGITNHPELTVSGNISSFGEDGEGEIWMSSMQGNFIVRIEAGP